MVRDSSLLNKRCFDQSLYKELINLGLLARSIDSCQSWCTWISSVVPSFAKPQVYG